MSGAVSSVSRTNRGFTQLERAAAPRGATLTALLAARICGFFGINPIAGSGLQWATVSPVTPRSEAASLTDVLQLPTGPERRR